MTTEKIVPLSKKLPEALLADFAWHVDVAPGAPVVFDVPEDYEQILRNSGSASEVLGIQRLISLVRRSSVSVHWGTSIAAQVSEQPHLFPLLAILLLLDSVSHLVWTDGVWQHRGVKGVGKGIQTHKLLKTKPGESDLTVSLEGRVSSLAPDLYDLITQRLLPRENFVTLAVDLFGAQIDAGKPVRDVYNKANLLGTILAELIENSEVHGRLDTAGRPILSSAVRGVMFRRVILTFDKKRTKGEPATTKEVECFEASIFDSGVGYYESYTREALTPETDVSREWAVLHKCLERHFYPELPDSRPAHRGMGLYEALRALQVLKGRIEFRTGGVYAYRTFFDEELQASMEERKPLSHIAWPKPRLLDVEKKYLAVPTKQELLTGSSVRILVPLG